jgi:ubiquinone/menaquinone biosynthesis C-methylase UbiE
MVIFCIRIGLSMAFPSFSRFEHPEPPPWLYAWMARGSILRLIYRLFVADLAATLPAGARVLDVGTGPGFLLRYLAGQRPDLQLWGVDLSSGMIRQARRPRGAASLPAPPRLLVAAAQALPFPAGVFDHALATFSLHIWQQPLTGLQEMVRVLRPGGAAWVYELRRQASLRELRAFAREAKLPFPLVYLGFKTVSRHHALRDADFLRLLAQAAGPLGQVRPVHHLFWRAELARDLAEPASP